jgi:phosphate transport system protein
MVLRFFRAQDNERLERIEGKIQQMLEHDRREFDLAMDALLGKSPAATVNDEVRATDRLVNELEREIRRELLVHASVFGGIDTPAVLVYMSVVKDIERIGDYAKNIVDLALDGANFGELPDSNEWRQLQGDVSKFIMEAGAAFKTREPLASRRLLSQGDRLLDVCDEGVSALVRDSNAQPQPVARALAYRYLKRVVAHLMNVLSAVVMPLDRLDYFDEDPEDRGRT